MLKVLLIVTVVVLTICCVVELAQTKGTRVRITSRRLWLFAVICVSVIGLFAQLFVGRPSSRPRPCQLGPDDDEDFLRDLH